MKRSREKNLDDKVIEGIVHLLDGWSGKLSWEALIDAFEQRSGLRYTRQALHRHERVRKAFSLRKEALGAQAPSRSPSERAPELQAALDRIARLEAENQRLAAENNSLLEQFARWAYNAQTRSLSLEFLNTPLPAVDRERSTRFRTPKASLHPKRK